MALHGPPEITVDAFVSMILDSVAPVDGVQSVLIAAALGRALAEDVTSSLPLPPFDQSAMDGYGINQGDLGRTGAALRLVGSIAAGRPLDIPVLPGESVKLFTGAPVPASVAAVARREIAVEDRGMVRITEQIVPGADIRRRGEDVAVGDTILAAGTVIDPRQIGLLAAAGVEKIDVRRRIRIALLSTGDELRNVDEQLVHGTIRDSNRPMLGALLASPRTMVVDCGRHEDNPHVLARRLADAAAWADLIVSSGGASGSDADPLAAAMTIAGGKATNYRLALSPGKPIVFGAIGRAVLLGLSGNPLAAFVACQLFVYPVAATLAGSTFRPRRGEEVTLESPADHRANRLEFLPASIVGRAINGQAIVRVGDRGSGRLRPLSVSDGLVELTGPATSCLNAAYYPGGALRIDKW